VQRRHIIICAVLVAVIAAGALSARFLLRQRERAAMALSGVAATPDLSRWPAELAVEISREASAVAMARSPAEPLARLAALYCANGFAQEGGQALAALRRLDPGEARWPYLQADLRLRAGDQEGAEREFRAALERNPGYAPGWLRLGELQQGLGELDRARESFAKALAADPQGVWAQYDSIFFEAQHGSGADSQRARLAELAGAHPGVKEVHELLADILAAARDTSGAARERQLAARSEFNLGMADPWTDELSASCFDSNRLVLRGIEMRREGRFGEAEALFKRAVQLAPQVPANPLPWDLLSNFYLKMNRPDEARATLESAVADFPDEPEMHLLLARLLCAEHKPADAIAAARTAIRRWPERGDLHAALGRALGDAGDNAGAETALREALALDPTLTEAQGNLGTTLLELGKRDEARAQLEKALSMRPDYPEALYSLGRMDLEDGDFAAAEPYASRLFALNPDDPNARLLLGTWHLVKGLAAGQAGDLDEADRQFRAGLGVSPEDGALLRAAGSLALQQGRLADAAEAFGHYVRVEPADPQGYLALGLALQKVGRTADAAAAFQGGLDAAQKAGDPSLVEQFKGLLGR
jgi:tetratricopeptide (TPR) repeat protein